MDLVQLLGKNVRREVEIPSDLFGVIYIELDPGEGWKHSLIREIRAAGLPLDAREWP